jgi:transcriptional regulator with XRE-family HTH domain
MSPLCCNSFARGFSRARLAATTGLSETRVRQISQGRQRVTSYEVLERIADGLSIPRPRLGLATGPDTVLAHDRGGLADPALHDAWADLLQVLTARSNTDGCTGLRRAVDGQSKLIASARAATTGMHRARLTAAAAHWVEFRSWIEANSDRPSHAEVLLDRAHAIDKALRLVSSLEDAPEELGGHSTIDYVRASEGRCRQLLGESAAAMRAYEEVLAGCPRDGRLDDGMWRADLALAYLDEGEPQRAAEVGLSAVRVATATSSARALRAVGRLLPRLRRDRGLPAVPEFTDAYRAALGAVTMNL